MQYKYKKSCVWSFIKYDDNDNEWIWAVKTVNEYGNKTYRWKPQRIKLEWLEMID